ncbi:MAG: hypothetical protein ACRC46_15195 [Thermoguttaceae bacterium]
MAIRALAYASCSDYMRRIAFSPNATFLLSRRGKTSPCPFEAAASPVYSHAVWYFVCVAENRAKVVLNEAKVPQSLATAMRTTGIGA